MKNLRSLFILPLLVLVLGSCGVLKRKEGCPTNGKNVGAEKVLSGETPRKTPKFRA